MFKFDKNTIPYHISNLVFYVFTTVVIALIFAYGFLPPILEVASGEGFFSGIGVREVGGLLFFVITAAVPLLVIFGAVYHLYKLITFNKNKEAAE
ncbi:hypothetical protein [Corticicoccus populi]|uniref:Uncharacterized protein n=1 Tax=Corticicoccus populi TaxID=1812821 RepID=A0ABW5WWR6_9STAP